MKNNKKEIAAFITVILTGIIYVLITKKLGYGIPCLIHYFTGYDCPSCGASRMFIALSSLDFKAAFKYNPFLMIAIPIWIVIYIFYKLKKINGKTIEILLEITAIIAVIFGIARNII